MSFLTSAIQFGAYSFPSGYMIKSRQLDDQVDEADLLGQIGTAAPAGAPKSAIVTVSGEMGAGGDVNSSGSPMLTLDDFENELNLMYATLSLGAAQLVAGYTPARYLMAFKKGIKVQHTAGYGRRNGAVDIDFLAPDPRWLSATTHSWTSGSVTNAGNAPSYPLFTLHGPITNPTIKIVTGSSPIGVEIDMTLTLASGLSMTVNCDPRQRQVAILVSGGVATEILTGIVNTLGTGDCFPFLQPNSYGPNTVTITGAGSASMAWQDAWWL